MSFGGGGTTSTTNTSVVSPYAPAEPALRTTKFIPNASTFSASCLSQSTVWPYCFRPLQMPSPRSASSSTSKIRIIQYLSVNDCV